jgi:hypothetical protein
MEATMTYPRATHDPAPNDEADETAAHPAAAEVSGEDLDDFAGGKFVGSPGVWYGDEELRDHLNGIQNG